jgi:hypothetical protein
VPDNLNGTMAMANVEAEAGKSTQPAPDPSVAGEQLSHLYRMSATAGVATTDYAAINNLSIVAMLLGLGSIVAAVSIGLVIIPCAGLICAVVALMQIRGSNGTQTGRGFAWVGLLLSLGIGATVLGMAGGRYLHERRAERQIESLIAQIGDDVRSEKYAAIYDRVSARFQGRITRDVFVRKMETLNQYDVFGRVESIRWNQEPMYFQVTPDTGAETVSAMAFLRFTKLPDPTREVIVFVRQGDTWVIDDIPRLFPSEKPKPGAMPSRAGPSPQP